MSTYFRVQHRWELELKSQHRFVLQHRLFIRPKWKLFFHQVELFMQENPVEKEKVSDFKALFSIEGNTWIAENLGTLLETLKDIGENIDANPHNEILVRKTGELFVRQKRGRKKRAQQRNHNQQWTVQTSDEDE